MITEKRQTETYVLTGLDSLDPVTAYVTNYKPGQGKIVIECFGEVWAHYWGAMGDGWSLQGFIVNSDNDYLLNKLLNTCNTDEYHYLVRILNAVKGAFSEELEQSA